MKTQVTRLELRIDWSEMDLYGHINNVAFLKYVQASRVNFWEHIGLNAYHTKTEIGPILAKTSCNFLKPLHFPGSVIIEAHATNIGLHRFGIRHKLLNEEDEQVAEAEDIIVVYDFQQQMKSPMPPFLLEALERFL